MKKKIRGSAKKDNLHELEGVLKRKIKKVINKNKKDFLESILAGISDIAKGNTISHSELKRRLAAKRKKRRNAGR